MEIADRLQDASHKIVIESVWDLQEIQTGTSLKIVKEKSKPTQGMPISTKETNWKVYAWFFQKVLKDLAFRLFVMLSSLRSLTTLPKEID